MEKAYKYYLPVHHIYANTNQHKKYKTY